MPMYEGRQANAEALLKSAEKDLEEARAHLARFRENVEKQARADRTIALLKDAYAPSEAKLRDRAREFAACLLEEAIGADDSRLETPIARVSLTPGGAWVACEVFVRL